MSRLSDLVNSFQSSGDGRRTLRSQRWFAPDSLRAFGHRSRIKQMGYALEEFDGRPAIAIVNTWSDLACCHSHFRDRAEHLRTRDNRHAPFASGTLGTAGTPTCVSLTVAVTVTL